MNKNLKSNELLELKYWLTGYLHQDFDAEFGSVDNALNVYKLNESAEKVKKLKHDLENVIESDVEENDLRDLLLTKLDCCYYYLSEWKSTKDWLRHLQCVLNQ